MFSIYVVTNKINNKKYIGLTKQNPAHNRWTQHKSYHNDANKTKVFYRAIRKYGSKNFSFDVIYQSEDKEHSREMEIYFIKLYETMTRGYNMTEGGEGIWGYKMSKEARIKMSSKAKERSAKPEWRRKQREMKLGKKRSEEAKKKTSKTLRERYKTQDHPTLGRKLSKDHKKKLSNAMMGVKKTKEEVLKRANTISKNWELTDPNGNKITIRNLRKFCRENNLSAENMWKVSKGFISHSQGWKCKKMIGLEN
jgi:group I intron endonuclease